MQDPGAGVDSTGEAAPVFNAGPVWLTDVLLRAGSFLERFGWFVLLGLAFVAWLIPRVRILIRRIQEDNKRRREESAEVARVAHLEAERRKRAEQLQRRLALDGQEWEAHKKAQEEEKRHRKLEELAEKERRLGIRPRGVARFANQPATDEDDLYS